MVTDYAQMQIEMAPNTILIEISCNELDDTRILISLHGHIEIIFISKLYDKSFYKPKLCLVAVLY